MEQEEQNGKIRIESNLIQTSSSSHVSYMFEYQPAIIPWVLIAQVDNNISVEIAIGEAISRENEDWYAIH